MAKKKPDPPPSKSSRRKCPKKKRGPTRNPFFLFRKEVAMRLKRKIPKISPIEITKRAAECWRKMSEKQKDCYRQRNAKFCPTCKRAYRK